MHVRVRERHRRQNHGRSPAPSCRGTRRAQRRQRREGLAAVLVGGPAYAVRPRRILRHAQHPRCAPMNGTGLCLRWQVGSPEVVPTATPSIPALEVLARPGIPEGNNSHHQAATVSG